jgi:signal peptidase II
LSVSEALEGAPLATERRKYVLVACVVAGVLLLDQLTKQWVASTLTLHQSMPVVDGLFHITYVRNTGAAFSLLAGKSAAFRVPFFALVSLVAGFALVTFVRRTPASQRLVLIACAGVLGGALGNLVDRLRYGEVIDFLDVHWRGFYWPAFNVADSCISVGVVVLLISSLATASDDDRSHQTIAR